jgi:hypothetical protein
MNKPALVNLKSLPYGGAQYVVTPDLEQFVKSAIAKATEDNCLWNTNIKQKFLDLYRSWITQSTFNTIVGLEDFPIATFSSGTTEAFDKFYLKNLHRRLRYFRGEYMYHQVAGRQYFKEAKFVEDDDLDSNDVLVLSLPFSDTGNAHPAMEETLKKCTALGIPVLLDCAYFGICSGIEFNLNYKCITDLTFSLSKTFPVPHLRIGMRLTRTDDDDALLVMNKTDYVNRLSCAVGVELLENFSPDMIVDRYQKSQIELCNTLGVTPSKCVIFGIDESKNYPQYNRGGTTNRLCLSKYLNNI